MSKFEMFHPSGRPYTMIELMDEYDPGWNTRPLSTNAARRMMNMYQPSVDTAYTEPNKKKALFSKLRKTIMTAAKEKKNAQEKEKQNALAHEEALAKRAEHLEAGKKVDFIKEGYEMFDEEFKEKDGYAEFITKRDYTEAEKSVKIPLEKTIKEREIKPEDVKDYLAKKFTGFYEKVYKKKKGGARKRRTQRKTKKGRKTQRKRKTGRKH